jgi:leucyl aminopeptidase
VPALPAIRAVRGSVASSGLLLEPGVDALALPVAPAGDGDDGVQPRTGTADAAARYGVDLADLADRVGATGKAGDVGVVHLPVVTGTGTSAAWSGLPRTLLLVGVGSGRPVDLRRAGAAVAKSTRGMDRVVSSVAGDGGQDAGRAFAEGYLLGAYRHPSRSTGEPAKGPAAELVLLGRHADAVLEAVRRSVTATWTVRALTSTPADTKSPAWLATQMAVLATGAGLEVEVLEPDELRARGFHGLLAVGSGSATGPRLATVRYRPAPDATGPTRGSSAPRRHVVLVGKGITFDTGGISIKPRESMVTMKTDMAGAAVALATVVAAASAGVRHDVTAVLPLAENAVGAASYRSGDVIRTYGGRTVEVVNTDAEGRIVLADALSHADLDLDPDVVVDVATLTGAVGVALGRSHAALYTADDALADELVAAGLHAGEPLWRMPLVADYRRSLRSDVADVRQASGDPTTGAGSVVAALFLEQFVGDRRWAHLDIAGAARATSARHEVPEGATGFGARLLLRWLTQLR